MRGSSKILIHLAVALLFGLTLGGVSLYTSWQSWSGMLAWHERAMTEAQIRHNDEAITRYRQERHALPKTLAQLVDHKDLPTDEGVLKDGWGHPLVYTATGDHYQIISYGEDGRPGGVGWDTDMTRDTPYHHLPKPTLQQFWTHHYSGPIARQTMVGCGFWGAVLCFLAFYKVELSTRRSWVIFLIQAVVLLGVSAFFAVLITMLGYPSGH